MTEEWFYADVILKKSISPPRELEASYTACSVTINFAIMTVYDYDAFVLDWWTHLSPVALSLSGFVEFGCVDCPRRNYFICKGQSSSGVSSQEEILDRFPAYFLENEYQGSKRESAINIFFGEW